jgi:hypothetical protein
MKNKKRNAFILLLLILAITYVLNSCGARKSEKLRNSETTESVLEGALTAEKTEDSNLKVTETMQVDDKNETVTEEEFYEPIDILSPSRITDPDGKTILLYNVKKITRKTTRKNNTKTDQSVNTEQVDKLRESVKISQKQDVSGVKKSEDIKIEREAYSVFNWFWVLLLVPVWWLWKNRTAIKKPWL